MAIRNEIIDELIKDLNYDYANPNPELIVGEKGLLHQLQKAILERALQGEMTHHLGYKKNERKPDGQNNSRNGSYRKKIISDKNEEFEVSVPRDREGKYEPLIIEKGKSRFKGFDDKIIALYARGMTVREIQGYLHDMYEVEVSHELISTVTDSVLEEVKEWQNRPLDRIYPIVWLDALVVNVRDEGQIVKKSVYLVLGLNMEGKKELLGIWIERQEGAKFWLKIVNDLKNRGVEQILIACVDGLKGFPAAINSIYPKAQVQQCIVHLVRNSLNYVSWKDRKEVIKDLRKIYSSPTVESGEEALLELGEKWNSKYPMISQQWENNWEYIIPFYAYPPEIRKVIYTTNAIESMNRSLRKVMKTRSIFPSDEAVIKLIYLAIKNISRKWTMPIQDWKAALNYFSIMFPDAFQSGT